MEFYLKNRNFKKASKMKANALLENLEVFLK
jgi:hypothetical protein